MIAQETELGTLKISPEPHAEGWAQAESTWAASATSLKVIMSSEPASSLYLSIHACPPVHPPIIHPPVTHPATHHPSIHPSIPCMCLALVQASSILEGIRPSPALPTPPGGGGHSLG